MIRKALPGDVPALHAMIRELAAFHDEDETEATDEQLHDALFGADPGVFALIAEAPGEHGPEPAGFALWFRNFSTWTGTHGVYLEDLYVRPQHRGGGHGKALLAALAGICVERGYDRFEWSAHTENTAAIDFYKSLGAEEKDIWTGFRLSGAPLHTLAESRSVNMQ
ncbi:GNAT family N-acetyltransferase [Streptomyces sp. A7024]|uniref:GNAT family N-acetyltransferase n=1 Tax=Streptomyces coryli TaxID=1128680 RepID=A0A6G4U9U9_9ACTN|nr:GNAT family N-acetyltransferase [Streptomyces coryli]NGN68903.1 GNAT family N-acetyltransferase [Streptomyces coryli]